MINAKAAAIDGVRGSPSTSTPRDQRDRRVDVGEDHGPS
jgi:hypothetical protein